MKLSKSIDLIHSEISYIASQYAKGGYTAGDRKSSGLIRQEFILDGWCRIRVCSHRSSVFVTISYDFLGDGDWMHCRRGGSFRLSPEAALDQLRRFRPE